MGVQQNGASVSPPAAGKKSVVMNVAGLTMFMYAAVMLSLWQAVLYVYLGSHYDTIRGNQEILATQLHKLGQLVESTHMAMIEDSDANQNLTTSLTSQTESLGSFVSVLNETLKQEHQQLPMDEQMNEQMKEFQRMLDEKANQSRRDLDESLNQSQRDFGETVKHNQAEILKAVDSVENRLSSLELSGSALEGSLGQNKNQLTELSKKLEERHRSLREKVSKMAQSASDVTKTLSSHLSESVEFRPLKDMSKWRKNEANGDHGFMSQLQGRGLKEGPPELFYIPSNLTSGRLLCLRGNYTTNGTLNYYSFAFKEGLPPDAVLLPGTTLISDTYWDYSNPWHAMYNLAQFVHWKTNTACRSAQRLIVYHWAELRTELGAWIKNVFEAASLPSQPETLSYNNRPVCFEEAVVSRIGIGGVPGTMLGPIFEEIRCTARRKCDISMDHVRLGPTKEQKVRLTLMARSGGRAFVNLKEWENVINSECRSDKGCSSSTVFVANLTFCQQVELMSKTDILVTVHGAQLTNMVFMSPGSRILEMFPGGWEKLAGHGQYIYSHLATWVGLRHEGYWRDSNTPQCPNPSDPTDCFSFYKDQPVTINSTHVSRWVANVIDSFNNVQRQALLPQDQREKSQHQFKWDKATCTCAS